jgi:hypothetical protein
VRDALTGLVESAVVARARSVAASDRALVTLVLVELMVALVTAALQSDPGLGMRLERELHRVVGAYLGLIVG